jgi:hypothetical protein
VNIGASEAFRVAKSAQVGTRAKQGNLLASHKKGASGGRFRKGPPGAADLQAAPDEFAIPSDRIGGGEIYDE